MAVQQPILNVTTIAGLLGIVGNNATQQLADEAALSALQQQVTNILSRSASAPGSYSPPGAAGAQSYSAKSTPWTSAASQGNLFSFITSTAGYCLPAYNYMDVWRASSLIDLEITSSASGQYYAARIQRYTNKAPTILGSNYTFPAMTAGTVISGVVILSNTLARITFFGTQTVIQYEYLLTWNGSALSATSASANGTAGNDLMLPLSSNTRRGILLGSASWLACGVHYYGGLAIGTVRDRNATTVAQIAQGSHSTLGAQVSPTPVANFVAHDVVGNGYVLRGGSFYCPADPTVRPALFLEYYDDYSSTRVGTLRVTNTNFGGWNWLVMVSPTLAIGNYRDAVSAGVTYTIAVSVNVGNASPLGLYGPFTTNALGTGNLQWPILFDGTDAYFFDITTMTTSAPFNITMRHLIFNSANTGSELTTTPANDIVVTLGATAAGSGGTGTALTSVVFIGAIQQADQMQVYYFGNSGTAATTGLYVETFNLS